MAAARPPLGVATKRLHPRTNLRPRRIHPQTLLPALNHKPQPEVLPYAGEPELLHCAQHGESHFQFQHARVDHDGYDGGLSGVYCALLFPGRAEGVCVRDCCGWFGGRRRRMEWRCLGRGYGKEGWTRARRVFCLSLGGVLYLHSLWRSFVLRMLQRYVLIC